ncbi:hypothetical protein HDU83_000538 [Entophlyctis luteolus]|nr:hypothetical protein HDU83_000538 [Entophlyctis luteolus]
MPGSTIAGRHLLGYCFLNLNECEKALREFKKCVKDGYFEDWQLVVELTIELEEKRKAGGVGELTFEAGGGLISVDEAFIE